jgi:hypothetical protein
MNTVAPQIATNLQILNLTLLLESAAMEIDFKPPADK